ncbi:hypothetical protein [Paenibacillus sp. DMB20]|uniref:hypothetical protein n=1 Tax=Paenibacillus sp. DMB20 TaxID=1642570 RepID=UPI000627AA1C|nr:hypothetical protein [Paenibacillus sp. DMB20]KKO51153.1 hypothetical protein XI25_29645 [Paenibacillus sp. DMB20]
MDKQYIENQIIQSKVKIHDWKKLIEEEEKKLFQLYGALETWNIVESRKPQLVHENNAHTA